MQSEKHRKSLHACSQWMYFVFIMRTMSYVPGCCILGRYRKSCVFLGRKDAARAGFDDDFIYREISLNPANRSVVFHQIVDPEAAKVFRRWEELDNKIPY